MKKTKMISFRVDEDLVNELDEFCRMHVYWSRSLVLARLLERFLHYSSRNAQFQIINWDRLGEPRKEIRFVEVSNHKDVTYSKSIEK